MWKSFLSRFIREHKISYAVGVIFMLAASYVQALFPTVLGRTVDALKAKHFNPRVIYWNILFILLIAAGTFMFSYIWRNLVIGNARKLECSLREELFTHFQRLSPEFYSQRKTGDLIAYAINDINAVRMTFGPATSMTINGVVICLVSIYSMARAVDWRLTVLALLPVPAMVFIMVWVGKEVKKRFRRVQETFSAISDRVNENINGIRVIKAYVQEDGEIGRFGALNSRMVETNMDMVRASAVLSPLIEICFTISFVMNLIIGGNMVLQGRISVGSFVAFNGYLMLILAPVLSIGRVITIVQRGMASLTRLNSILAVKPAILDRTGAGQMPEAPDLFVRELSFRYPGSQEEALRDITVSVPHSHTLGIVGKTGSGKSTLCKLLLHMVNADEGRIFFSGTDINDIRVGSLRDAFGFVPQDNFLFNASIYDNIRFFKDGITLEQVKQAARDSCIYDSIESMPDGFNSILGERGVNLSGGQKQRVSIARALVKDPEILVLDDALSAVDTITESRIIENLRRIRQNKTTIIVASRVSAVMHADEILVLDRGRIAERGTHEQLLDKRGIYSEIYDYQCR